MIIFSVVIPQGQIISLHAYSYNGAFTYYVSSTRGRKEGGLVSSLLLLTDGGGRGHGRTYVSIADLGITINEELSRLIFWSKRVCVGINYA